MRKAFVFMLCVLALLTVTGAACAGEWVDDYFLSTGADYITVDFEDFYADHPGDYYVCYAIAGNPYFTWHLCEAEECSYDFGAAPGLKYEVQLWYDPDQTGDSPAWEDDHVRKTRIALPGALDDFPYTLKSSVVGVRNTETEEFTEYDVIPLDVLNQDNLEIRYRWAWDFEVEEDGEFSMVLEITGPEGYIYVQSSSWKIGPDDTHYRYWQQNMTKTMQKYAVQKGAQMEGEFQMKVYINGKTFDALSFQMGYADLDGGGDSEPAAEPAPPEPTPPPQQEPDETAEPAPPAADIEGLWKHISTKIMGVVVDSANISTEMYYDFHGNGTVTVTTIGLGAGTSVVENDWRMEGDSVFIDDVELMYLDGDELVMDMMGVGSLHFARFDGPIPNPDETEPETEPEPDQKRGKANGSQMPDSVSASNEAEFFGTWKMTHMQFNGNFRKSNASRTYVISQGQAEEITLTGSVFYPTEFRDGQLVMLVDGSGDEQLEMPFYLLTDGAMAQDMSAFYGSDVIVYCEKQQ